MKTIRAQCAECQAAFSVDESLAGKRLKCKRCGNRFVLKSVNNSAPAPANDSTDFIIRPVELDPLPRIHVYAPPTREKLLRSELLRFSSLRFIILTALLGGLLGYYWYTIAPGWRIVWLLCWLAGLAGCIAYPLWASRQPFETAVRRWQGEHFLAGLADRGLAPVHLPDARSAYENVIRYSPGSDALELTWFCLLRGSERCSIDDLKWHGELAYWLARGTINNSNIPGKRHVTAIREAHPFTPSFLKRLADDPEFIRFWHDLMRLDESWFEGFWNTPEYRSALLQRLATTKGMWPHWRQILASGRVCDRCHGAQLDRQREQMQSVLASLSRSLNITGGILGHADASVRAAAGSLGQATLGLMEKTAELGRTLLVCGACERIVCPLCAGWEEEKRCNCDQCGTPMKLLK